MPKVEEIWYNGKVYRRYPEADNRTDRVYFQRPGGKGFLHRHVWEDYNGPIPDGFHVHHLDEDAGNNDISNLALLPSSYHLSEHSKAIFLRNKSDRLKNLDKIREKASEWHRSDEGRAWHREHAKKTITIRAVVERNCDFCGIVYKTQGNGRDKFCSDKCGAANRRELRLDNIDRICVVCGNSFSCDRYSKIKTCSRGCGIESMKRSKRRVQ